MRQGLSIRLGRLQLIARALDPASDAIDPDRATKADCWSALVRLRKAKSSCETEAWSFCKLNLVAGERHPSTAAGPFPGSRVRSQANPKGCPS